MIKLKNLMFVITCIPLFSMEKIEKETRFRILPIELKMKITLFLMRGLSDVNYLTGAIKEFKQKIRVADRDILEKEIFKGNNELSLFFNRKLLFILQNRALRKNDINACALFRFMRGIENPPILCVASSLNTKMAWQILQEDYNKNKKLFYDLIPIIRNRFYEFSWVFVNLIDIINRFLKKEDQVSFLTMRDAKYPTEIDEILSVLLDPVPGETLYELRAKIFRSLLNLAAKLLSPGDKKNFLSEKINTSKGFLSPLEFSKMKLSDVKDKNYEMPKREKKFYLKIIKLLKKQAK